MTSLAVAQLWYNFLENFLFKIGFFWHSQKNGVDGVGPPQSGGMKAVVWLLAKQQVRDPQPSPWCLFHADTC